MKKLILTGLSFLFAITLTFAQNTTTPQNDPEGIAKTAVNQLTEKLKLSEAQKTTIYNIVLESNKAAQLVVTDTISPKEELQQKLATIQSSATAKISESLTDEQKAIFAQLIQANTPKEQDTPRPVENKKEETNEQ